MGLSEHIDIQPAGGKEREWASGVMASTDPWITLGISQDQCLTTCLDTHYDMFIAHLDSEPCGMILVDRRGVAGSPYIKSIAVQENFRGMGVGRALITFAETLFRNESPHLFMCVSSFNHRAQKLYTKLGFRKVGEFDDYIIKGKSEILLYKRLH